MRVFLWYKYLNLPQMKKLLYLLLFLFIGIYCFAQDDEKLPIKLWEEIVEINNNQANRWVKWTKDVKISLEGNYTLKDSVNLRKIIKKLDDLTETISIKFTDPKKSNFKISFINDKGRDYSMPSIQLPQIIASIRVNIKNTSLDLTNILEKDILVSLLGEFQSGKLSFNKRESIFQSHYSVGTLKRNKTSVKKEDLALFKEFYKKGFEKRLQKAEIEFAYVLDEIESRKIKTRDKSLWWVKNPISMIFLPLLILTLMFLWAVKKCKTLLSHKIPNNLVRFTLLSLVVLSFIFILIVLGVSWYDFLTIPDDYNKVPVFREDTLITTLVSLVLTLPFLFLFRFIELKIQKSFYNIYIKTTLVFFSTGLIPFVCFVLIYLIVSKDTPFHLNHASFVISEFSLYFMIVATTRAVFGFFIFKEHKLMVENEKKLSNLRELKAQAELKSLQSQINPHFLYNSLNSIASLAPIDAKKTQEMAHSLSDLFKYSINRKGKKMSTVKDEIDMVQSYLDIEKIRFGDRLHFKIEVNDSILNHEIPLFLIQPLVENAVKHGVSKNKDKGEIILKIDQQANELIISVYDNGPNFPEGLVSGHGLQTVFDLLRLSYGDKGSLNWTNTPEKMITITIPETI